MCLNQGAVIPVLALVTSRSLDEIAIKAFLQQAGYLAIKHFDSDDMATLGVPNQEVAVSLAQLIFDLCAQMVTVTPFVSSTNWELMLAGDLLRFIENINQLGSQSHRESSRKFLRKGRPTPLSALPLSVNLDYLGKPSTWISVAGSMRPSGWRIKMLPKGASRYSATYGQ